MAGKKQSLLDRMRENAKVRQEAIATYRAERDAGKTHEEASEAVVAQVKENYQPRSTSTKPVTAVDIERWVEIIKMILQILALFA